MSDPRRALALLRWVLRLSPRRFRERDGAEILAVEEMRIRSRLAAGDRSGARRVVIGATLDLLKCAVAEWSSHFLKPRGGDMDGWIRDLKFGARSLMRAPAFSAVAILTIALGIGANTAIFSVVEAVLLRPLPYATPDRLVTVMSEMRNRGVEDFPLSPPTFLDLKDGTPSLESFAGVSTFPQPLAGDGGAPMQLDVAFVTQDFLRVLGVQPALGRDFTEADVVPGDPNAAPGTSGFLQASAILSHRLWRQRFGSDPEIVGRIIDLGGAPTEVVGVLPEEFRFLMPAELQLLPDLDAVVAARIDFAAAPRNNVFLRGVGRMAPGATITQLRGQLDAVGVDVRDRFPINRTAGTHFVAMPLHRDLTASVRPLILALMGAVAFVLLIACANVANLFMVRAATREKELSVRAALGGDRRRIFRQVLLEGIVLAGVGGLLGTAIAGLGVDLLLRLNPANMPRLDGVGLDGRVLGFTVGATAVAALLFALLPAIKASRPDLANALRDRGRTGARVGQRRFRNVVVVGEIAMSLVLLLGAGLMIRSFVALNQVDPGFDAEGLSTVRVSPPATAYPTVEERLAFVDRMQRRLEQIPGVQAATGAFPMPMDGSLVNGRWGTAEAEADPEQFRQADMHFVLPGYFETLGTDLIEGRTFNAADQADSTLVVVVDETLAEQAFPGQSAVGQSILTRAVTLEPQWVEIVGVVEPRHHVSLTGTPNSTIYFHDRYAGSSIGMTWAVRTAGVGVGIDDLRRAVEEIDPNAPVSDVRPMSAALAEAMAPTRFALVLIGVFGAMALLLASVGLYGVLAYAVRLRAGEFGVRMAFGAERQSILRMVVAQGLALAGAGIGVGLVAATLLGGTVSAILVGVSPRDPVTFAAVPLFFAAVAVLASVIPAIRATRVDPAVTLRRE